MQADDRDEFRALLAKLCMCFDMPCTKAREDAYWSSLGRLSLPHFRHCIDHAIGPDYPGEKLPRAGDLWRIHKGTKAKCVESASVVEDHDHLAYFANRLMFMHLSHRGGLGSTGQFIAGEHGKSGVNDCAAAPEITRCLAMKRALVAEFEGYIREGDTDATPGEFARHWLANLNRVSMVTPKTETMLTEFMQRPDALVPFRADMARPLSAPQAAS